jgi:hypothetical protein
MENERGELSKLEKSKDSFQTHIATWPDLEVEVRN